MSERSFIQNGSYGAISFRWNSRTDKIISSGKTEKNFFFLRTSQFSKMAGAT